MDMPGYNYKLLFPLHILIRITNINLSPVPPSPVEDDELNVPKLM